jgi:hypothetical protein
MFAVMEGNAPKLNNMDASLVNFADTFPGAMAAIIDSNSSSLDARDRIRLRNSGSERILRSISVISGSLFNCKQSISLGLRIIKDAAYAAKTGLCLNPSWGFRSRHEEAA